MVWAVSNVRIRCQQWVTVEVNVNYSFHVRINRYINHTVILMTFANLWIISPNSKQLCSGWHRLNEVRTSVLALLLCVCGLCSVEVGRKNATVCQSWCISLALCSVCVWWILCTLHIIRKNIIPPPFGPDAPVCAGLLFCVCGLLCVLVLVHIVHSTTTPSAVCVGLYAYYAEHRNRAPPPWERWDTLCWTLSSAKKIALWQNTLRQINDTIKGTNESFKTLILAPLTLGNNNCICTFTYMYMLKFFNS